MDEIQEVLVFHRDRRRSTLSFVNRTPSFKSIDFLVDTPFPPENPTKAPLLPTTLWQGMRGAKGFVLMHIPTALAALGLPERRAI